jgi:dihydrofolate synthase/folylpolyglutamate synthase
MVLEEYLNSKPLYYDKIDYNTIELAWKKLEPHIKLPYVIHIVGTNGKGSTGRYLASFLHQLGKETLHYSSPHIIKFNERIWINGSDSSDKQLDIAHEKLQNILDEELKNHLTYFEYTTLIAILLSDGFDYIVLEAGLGGEFDATNIVKTIFPYFQKLELTIMSF